MAETQLNEGTFKDCIRGQRLCPQAGRECLSTLWVTMMLTKRESKHLAIATLPYCPLKSCCSPALGWLAGRIK